MNLTSLTISSLAAELHKSLARGVITDVDALSPAGLCLRIRVASRSRSLCVVTHPHFFCPFVCTRPRLSAHAIPFVHDLRRLLAGHTITSVEQWQHDRILRFELRQMDEIHGARHRCLILELVPRRQNIILVDLQNDIILQSLKRVTRRMSRYRLIRPGQPYQPPPEPAGLHPLSNSGDEFLEAIRQRPREQLREALAGCMPWASPYLLAELSPQVDLELHVAVAMLDDRRLLGFWKALTALAESLEKGPLQPALIQDQQGRGQVLLPYEPRSFPDAQKRTFTSLSLALEEIFHDLSDRWRQDADRKALSAGLHTALRRSRRALRRLETDLEESQRAEEFRKRGEIISANIARLKKGLSQARLPDPYSSSGRMVLIPMDPKLSPVENAQRYFKRSRKARAGLTKIQARLEEVRGRLDKLQDLRKSLQTSWQESAVKELKSLLDQLGIRISPARSEGRGKQRQFKSPPLTIALNGGWTIMVGRNNLENDRLTHQLAAPGDLWFHAQGVPGAHVILRREGRKDQPSKKVLEETASVAAYFSRARHSKMVPVVYTERRYVRKPKGAKPGAAIIEREKSLFVEPKPARGDSEQEK